MRLTELDYNLPPELVAQQPLERRDEARLMVLPVDEPPGGWLALIRGHRGLREGTRLVLDDGRALRIAGYQRPGRPLVMSDDSVPIEAILASAGALALPHYI